ncbi:MAG: hypothetical protein EBV03_05765 [Proteobacteria bacterium]|nr:hypothetical protein [Pseudomonadota bacterium]
MSIARFRQAARQFLATEPARDVFNPNDSLAFITSGAPALTMRHVAQDLAETLATAASGVAFLEHQDLQDRPTRAPHKSLEKYLKPRDRRPPPNIVVGDDPLGNNEVLINARNVKLVLDAYLSLGSEEALGHAEQARLADIVKQGPAVLARAARMLREHKQDFAFDAQSHAHAGALERFSASLADVMRLQLRNLEEGPGRAGSGNPKPES